MSTPEFRAQQTGNPVLDRVQNVTRDIVAFLKRLVTRLEVFELSAGVGVGRVTIQDRDTTLTSAQAAPTVVIVLGTLTATRQLVFPRPSDTLGPYVRWVINLTGQTLNVTVGTNNAPVLTGTSRAIVFETAGASFLT